MKRLLLALAMLFVVTAVPVRNAEAGALFSDAAVACVLGAGALGAGTYFGVVPALASGILVTPFAEIIAVNALIGCGIGVVGTVSATVIARVFDPGVTK